LMDTWISLGVKEERRKRSRWLTVLKSRGMAHSNSVHEYALTNDGLQILDGEPRVAAQLTGG
jgi:circadian clock protein KaiC